MRFNNKDSIPGIIIEVNTEANRREHTYCHPNHHMQLAVILSHNTGKRSCGLQLAFKIVIVLHFDYIGLYVGCREPCTLKSNNTSIPKCIQPKEIWKIYKSCDTKIHLEENVVSLTRTGLFLMRPKIGNSAIPNTFALCHQRLTM